MQGSLEADPTALIAQEATLIGDITIGAGCIIHPRASILATAGPIELGENCVVEELAVLESAGNLGDGSGHLMRIGKGNQFSVGCQIQARSIGDNNTFHPRCRVPGGIAISDNCSIGAGVTMVPVSAGAVDRLDPYTVVHGALADRRSVDPSRPNVHVDMVQAIEDRVQQDKLAFLRDNMPKFIRMRAV